MAEITWGLLIILQANSIDTGYRFDSFAECAEHRVEAVQELGAEELNNKRDNSVARSLVCAPMDKDGGF